MRRPLLIALIPALMCVAAHAAFDDLETGVRPLGMGGAFCAVADDADALHWNPAGLGRQERYGLTGGVFRPYGLRALQYQAAAMAVPARVAGTFGAAAKVFGRGGYYREETLILGWGRPAWRSFTVGAAVRYMALRLGDTYGADWCLGADAGLQWHPFRSVTLAAAVRNANAPALSADDERLARVVTAGGAFRPVPGVLVAVDVYRDLRHRTQVKLGQETVLLKHLAVRCGMQTRPARFSVGTGVSVKGVGCDYALYGHPVLGVTHQVGLRFNWGAGPRPADRAAAP